MSLLNTLFSDESGLSYTEYLILTILVGLSLVGTSVLFINALRAYLKRIFFIVSLPIP
ncbi:MAG: hypothetical protein ABIL02_00305 [candidate division WOR-3 bacterium]